LGVLGCRGVEGAVGAGVGVGVAREGAGAEAGRDAVVSSRR
jgi:hypothetical protein